jgi:hypothetical protein
MPLLILRLHFPIGKVMASARKKVHLSLCQDEIAISATRKLSLPQPQMGKTAIKELLLIFISHKSKKDDRQTNKTDRQGTR